MMDVQRPLPSWFVTFLYHTYLAPPPCPNVFSFNLDNTYYLIINFTLIL